ncbi:MAG: stage II sporulation protein M [Vulcanibacillus sp.]
MKRAKMKSSTNDYLKENFSMYIFTIILFIMGVIFGSYVIYSLSLSQKQELLSIFNLFYLDIDTLSLLDSQVVFKQVLIDNLKYLGVLWFLGLSIVGMPLIFILIFTKGLIVGFTVSFLIFELNWQGLLFSLASVIPQNIIIVPVLIIAGVTGINFSLSLIKHKGNKSYSYQQSITSYTLIILILGGFLVLASGFETFVSPYLMKGIMTLVN